MKKMKFEIIYSNAILNYLINHIGEICDNNHIYGNCDLNKFLIDLLYIFKYEDFSKKKINLQFKKICEPNCNMTARHFLQGCDNIYM